MAYGYNERLKKRIAAHLEVSGDMGRRRLAREIGVVGYNDKGMISTIDWDRAYSELLASGIIAEKLVDVTKNGSLIAQKQCGINRTARAL